MISAKKKRPGCLEFTGLVTTIWVLLLPGNMYMVFTERILARAVFARSIKELEGQLGSENPGSTILLEKVPIF